jgi:hypothetical protein
MYPLPVTLAEIDSFSGFVRAKLRQDEPAPSLEECLEMWRAEREREETIDAVRRGIEDMEAGRFYTLEEVDRMFREEFGLDPRET